MSIRVLIGFLPWILFYFVPLNTPIQIKVSITALFLLAVITSYKDLQRKFILAWCTFLFFLFIFISVVLLNFESLMLQMGILANSVLALAALGSLAIGKPFTMQYARLSVAKEKWSGHIFIFINQALTFAWGMSFLFNLGINVFQKIRPSPQLVMSILGNGATVAALIFTLWFPKWYRKRAEAKQK